MLNWILLLRLDWLLFAAVVCGSVACILERESVRQLFGSRTRRQWYWVLAVVLVGGAGAELHSHWVQHERRPGAAADASLYAYEIGLDGHAELAAGAPASDPRRRDIETTSRAWMQLNRELVGLTTWRRQSDGTWHQILEIHAPGDVERDAEPNESDAALWAQAEAGELVFGFGSGFGEGGRVERAVLPMRDGSGRVEAVLEVEFSKAHWIVATMRARLFTFVGLYLLIAMVGGAIVITRQRRRYRDHLREQEHLRASEYRFRGLCENIPNIAVQGYNRERRVTFWNRASEQLYGYTRAEALGRLLEDLIIPAPMRAGVIAAIEHWHATGEAIPAGELVLRHKNGSPVSVFSSHVMQQDSLGEPEMYCVDVPLAERDRALSALAASESNYQNLFEAVPHPLYVFDLGTLAILAANRATSVCYGYAPEELRRMCVLALPAPEQVDRVRNIIRSNPLGADFGPAESLHCRKDGQVLLCEISSHAVRWAGRDARMVLVQDITARRAAERRISGQAALLNKTAEAIVVIDIEQHITFWNRSATRLFGAEPSSMLGRPLVELTTGGHPVQAAFARTFAETKKDWRGEISTVDTAGRPLFLDISIATVRDDDGAPTAFLSITTDITLRKSFEAQSIQTQKMEVLGQLAGGVAHDFNSILMAMTLQLDVLGMDQRCHPATKTMLGDLKAMMQRAAKLVDQLLLFARKHAMEVRPLELNKALDDVLKMVRPLLGPNILLELAPAESALWIEADSCMIDQIVLNLCVNARDAMPQGGTLSIGLACVQLDQAAARAEPQARPGSFACLSFRDIGCGMGPDVIAHAFEPFFTTKEVGKGTGLGLSTVHGIVHQHRGWIAVDSTVGVGTVFRIYIPVSEVAGVAGAETGERTLPIGQETVLLVEDDIAVRRLCSVILVRLGYRVISCADAPEALALWEENSGTIDVLLSDLVIPGPMDGRALAARLREAQPALGIVLMSGNNAEIIKAGELAAPGSFFVQKPVDSEALARAVRQCLE
ncbi:MAG: PAS domain S-box protein [Opitutaceae bacterium]